MRFRRAARTARVPAHTTCKNESLYDTHGEHSPRLRKWCARSRAAPRLNKGRRTRMRTFVKKVDTAIEAGDQAKAREARCALLSPK